MKTNSKSGLQNLQIFYKSYRGLNKLLFEISVGVLAILGGLYIFLDLSHKVIEEEIILYDSIIMNFFYMLHSPFLTSVMKCITFFGGEIFLGAAIIVTTTYLFTTKHRKDAALFAFILFFGIILNLWLKGFFGRERPDQIILIIEKTFSFPSGHSMNSFVFFISLSYFIFHHSRNRKLGLILSLLSGVLVLLIGISRIYLGVHYPSDVLGGYAAGLVWFAVILLFEKILIFFKLFREYELTKRY